MFFEKFTWEEEKLGLISGISFVLIGVLAYAIHLENLNPWSIVLIVLGMLAVGGTAILFQLPRIGEMRAAISTFLGGITIGLGIILWVIGASLAPEGLFHEILIFSLTGAEMVLAFFAVGFLMLALYPPDFTASSDAKTPTNTKLPVKKENHDQKTEIDNDFFERL